MKNKNMSKFHLQHYNKVNTSHKNMKYKLKSQKM